MPRKPRFYLPGVPVHLVQRGHSRKAVFFEDEDYRAYLMWLGLAASRYDCAVHAYVLMTNHVHLLATPGKAESAARMMQYTGRHYVPFINHKYGRSGSLWEGRYKASIVDSEAYLLACMRYVEMNPVRAAMVAEPAAYPWSSYHCNGLGRPDPLVSPHALYTNLAGQPEARQAAYRELFAAGLDNSTRQAIQAACRTGTPLGNDAFRQQIESALRTRVGQARRGRPARQRDS